MAKSYEDPALSYECDLTAECDALRKQRDELLAALKNAKAAITEAVMLSATRCGTEYSFKKTMEQIDTVIASIEQSK